MVNRLKNSSTQGLYILTDQGGWVGSNTPGEADLDSLTLGTTYLYFDSVIRFESNQTANYESDIERGLKTWADGEGTRDWSTGGADKHFIVVLVETDVALAEKTEFFQKYWNRTARESTEIYLVRQIGSTTFRQFPNNVPALKKYVPVLVRGVNSIETGNIDKQNVTLLLEGYW